MDLNLLAAALLLAVGLLGYDAVRHSDVVNLQVIAAPSMSKSDRLTLDQATLDQEFEYALRRIAETPSLIPTPLIHTTQDEGVGLAVFGSIKMKHIANALLAEAGLPEDSVRLTLYVEQGQLHGLIHGVDKRVGTFRTTLSAGKTEPLIDFVHRCSVWVAAQLAPYTTTLFELQQHADDSNFSNVIDMAQHAKAAILPTPISVDRSLFDNLLGLVALFGNDPLHARASFEAAIEEDPSNPAPKLNAAFADLQLGDYPQAADRMQTFRTESSVRQQILLATAYMIWAAAEMGQRNFANAEALLAKSTALNPRSVQAYDLWAELKLATNETEAAAAHRRQAKINTGYFQNYGEIAALYFQPAWQPGKAVTRSSYGNPPSVQFH